MSYTCGRTGRETCAGLEGDANDPLFSNKNITVGLILAFGAPELDAADLTGTALARVLGAEGEDLAGLSKFRKTRIESLTDTARYRVPDHLTDSALVEVKNVALVRDTNQMRDFEMFSSKTNREFILVVRENTILAPRLQGLENAGRLTVVRALRSR